MSFEDRFLARLDKSREAGNSSEFQTLLPKAYKRAHEVIADCQIQEKVFDDLYSPEAVARDTTYVRQMKEKFGPGDTMHQYADILEAILIEQVELSNWFGENASTIKTSAYDDIKNGIDMIVRYEPTNHNHPAQLLALGVDVTFSADGTEKKLTRMFENLRRGKLGTLKYYYSEADGYRGERNNLPLIVLGMEKSMLENVATAWMKRENRALEKHAVQNMLLAQADAQLDAMRRVVRASGNQVLERIISGSLDTIRTELAKRNKSPLPQDRVWTAMQRSIQRLSA
ncbi:hypothetical protein K2X96_00020 [Patescibacteria group bacterium]|jgi:hypothetical protein|nr:hypothetical protein [Patescibacteria group bacterium]